MLQDEPSVFATVGYNRWDCLDQIIFTCRWLELTYSNPFCLGWPYMKLTRPVWNWFNAMLTLTQTRYWTVSFLPVLRIRIRDPVPFWPLDPGWVKNSGSGMNNPDHIFECLEKIFLGSNTVLKFFDADPESGTEKIRIWDPGWKKFGSGIWNGKIRIRDLEWKNSDPE